MVILREVGRPHKKKLQRSSQQNQQEQKQHDATRTRYKEGVDDSPLPLAECK